MALTAIVADDAPLIRQAVSGVLETAGIDVRAQVGDAAALIEATAALAPDVVLVDIRMPPTRRLEGLEAALTLRAAHPRLGILLLSQHVQARYLNRLVAHGTGGFGYLLKERAGSVDSFVDSVRTVAAGGCAFDPEVVAAMMDPAVRHDPVESLSPRERQVLALMAQGCSNRAICAQLRLAEKTVESHVRRVFERLGLADEPDTHRRVHAVLAWLRASSP